MKTISFISIALLAIGVPLIEARAQADIASQRDNNTKASGAGSASDRPSEIQARVAAKRKRGHSLSPAYKEMYDLGVKNALAGRNEEAIEAFKQAILLNPGDGDTYYSLGNVYADSGHLSEAVAAYREAIKLNERDGEAYHNLGVAYLKLGRYGDAVDALIKATSIYPTWAEAHYNLSNAYYKLDQKDAAIAAYKRAVHLRPDYANRESLVAAPTPKTTIVPVAPVVPARSNVVAKKDVAVAKSSPAPSANTARPAADPAPKDAKAYYRLGVKYGRSKQYQQAAEAFQQAVRLNPRYSDAYFGLGHAYSDLGRLREAAEAYQQAININPKDEEAYQRLGEVYVKLRAQPNVPQAITAAQGDGIAVGNRVSETIASPPTPSSNYSAGLPDGISSAFPSRNASPKIDTSDPPPAFIPVKREVTPATAAPPASIKENAQPKVVAVNTTPASGDAGRMAAAPGAATVKSETRPKAPSSGGAAAAADLTKVYHIGPGDVLDIRLLNSATNQSTLYTVSEGGLLDYPLLHEPLAVAGMTTEQVDARLASEIKRSGIDEHPRVAVSVRDYASHAIMVSGLVSDPGTKILRREGVPLYVVLADAQPRPEAGRAVIRSHATGQTTVVDLNDPEAMNMLVRPADVVVVEKRPAEFYYVGGAVREPGEKAFHSGITLTQAVLAAGGVSRSSAYVVKVSRPGADGLLVVTKYNLRDISSGRSKEPVLQPGDRIEVEQ